MNVQDLKVPTKGFTKAEREWIKNVLIPAIKTVHAVSGHLTTVTDTSDGQVINAQDCSPSA